MRTKAKVCSTSPCFNFLSPAILYLSSLPTIFIIFSFFLFCYYSGIKQGIYSINQTFIAKNSSITDITVTVTPLLFSLSSPLPLFHASTHPLIPLFSSPLFTSSRLLFITFMQVVTSPPLAQPVLWREMTWPELGNYRSTSTPLFNTYSELCDFAEMRNPNWCGSSLSPSFFPFSLAFHWEQESTSLVSISLFPKISR
jgi:hypothetical protein